MNKTIQSLFNIIMVAAVLAVAYFIADSYLVVKKQQVRNEAIDGCAQNNRYVRTEDRGGVSTQFDEVSQGPFNKCLQLKNIK